MSVVGCSVQQEATRGPQRFVVGATDPCVRKQGAAVETCCFSFCEVSDGAQRLSITACITSHKHTIKRQERCVFDKRNCFLLTVHIRVRHQSKACWELKDFLLSKNLRAESFLWGSTTTSSSGTDRNFCCTVPEHTHTHFKLIFFLASWDVFAAFYVTPEPTVTVNSGQTAEITCM